MSSANCKAITKSGKKCKLKANSSGYCHIHDPEKIAKSEAKQHLPEMFAVDISAKSFSERRGLKPISEIMQPEIEDLECDRFLIIFWDMRSDYLRHPPRSQATIKIAIACHKT